MKSFTIVGLAVLASVQGAFATDSATTVVCEACKQVSTTPDIVTRSPVPTTPCTEPVLTTVPVTGGNGGNGGSPTSPGGNSTATMTPPVAAGNSNKAAGGMIVVAIAAAMLV